MSRTASDEPAPASRLPRCSDGNQDDPGQPGDRGASDPAGSEDDAEVDVGFDASCAVAILSRKSDRSGVVALMISVTAHVVLLGLGIWVVRSQFWSVPVARRNGAGAADTEIVCTVNEPARSANNAQLPFNLGVLVGPDSREKGRLPAADDTDVPGWPGAATLSDPEDDVAIPLIGVGAQPFGNLSPRRPARTMEAEIAGGREHAAANVAQRLVRARFLHTDPHPMGSGGHHLGGSRDGLDDRGLPIPDYPSICKRRREQGLVEIEIEVRADGSVAHVRILNDAGFPRLAEAASRAVASAHLAPATEDGKPVPGKLVIPYRFSLD